MDKQKKIEQRDAAFVKHLMDFNQGKNDEYEKRGWGRPWPETEDAVKEFLDIK